MKPEDNDKSLNPESIKLKKTNKKSLPLKGFLDEPDHWKSYTLEQKKKARKSREKIESATQVLSVEKGRGRRPPLPESARGLTVEQISRTSPVYFVLRWESYVAIVAFVIAMTYFPWGWVADWGVVRVLVVAMEQLIASIDKLPAAARNLPVDESKAHLSIIHFTCMVTLIYRVFTQRPTLYREIETWRFFVGFLMFGFGWMFFASFPFFWQGYFRPGIGNWWHESLLEVSGFHTALWLFQLLMLSCSLSFLKQIMNTYGEADVNGSDSSRLNCKRVSDVN